MESCKTLVTMENYIFRKKKRSSEDDLPMDNLQSKHQNIIFCSDSSVQICVTHNKQCIDEEALFITTPPPLKCIKNHPNKILSPLY